MDLYAYCQIGDFEKLMKDNGIEVPRLRGVRFMKNETLISPEDIFTATDEVFVAVNLICSFPRFSLSPSRVEYSSTTDLLREFYLTKGVDGNYESIRWDRIHGKHRKNLKFAIKKRRRRCEEQLNTFNKYVGREDVLYIHARIGGGNWSYYHSEVDTKPWFIERVDDAFDSTYCDIYAKILN